jgi:hypothetical protein
MLGTDFVETWKRTNFGIPNEINAARFPCRSNPGSLATVRDRFDQHVARVERQRNPGPAAHVETAVPDFATLNPGYATVPQCRRRLAAR